ncbi:hypothetical protein RhiJN_22695 [Ceratobasidium sp. AG-Ba]|nr:hypothetical protein RhiJN_22695 [Ceratobasidium sp. AG-Ba]
MLWGMFWFVFAIGSNAYASGLPSISEKYFLATRITVLSLALAFVAVGILVVLFFYKVWILPGAEPIIGRTSQPVSNPTQSPFVHVDIREGGHNTLQTDTEDVLPDYSTYMPAITLNPPPNVPQPGVLFPEPQLLQYPPTIRRPTVEFEDSPTTTPDRSTLTMRSQSLDTESNPASVTSPLTASSRGQSLDSTVHFPNTWRRDSISSTQTPLSASFGTPPISVFPHPDSRSGEFFIDIDPTQLAPYGMTAMPQFFVSQRGSQITLIASTGRTALLLTTQNEEIWSFLLEVNSRYKALVEDIRLVCEQYGEVEHVIVPRQVLHQIRPQATGQAYIKFAQPAAASRALRGFFDQPLEHCPVSARLLTEEEEETWGTTRQLMQPSLTTVTEEGSMYEDAVSGRVESPENITNEGGVGDVSNGQDARPTEGNL